MKIKKCHIMFTILLLVMLIGIQTVTAADNTTSYDSLCENDLDDKINVDSDLNLPSEVNVNSTKKVEIDFNSSENIEKSDLNLKLNNSNTISEINDFEVSNKKIKFNLGDADFAGAVLNINYKNTTSTVVLKNIVNVKIESLTESGEYQVGTFDFKITDLDTGEAVVNKSLTVKYRIQGVVVMDQTQTITTNSEGIATFYLNKVKNPSYKNENVLPVGKYNITVRGSGDLKGELQTQITIRKADVIITPSSYAENPGSLKNYTVKVTSKATGEAIKFAEIVLNIPGTADVNYRLTTSKDGIASIDVSKLNIGEYPLTAVSNDTNLNNASAEGKISITKIKVKVNILSTVTYFNSGTTVKVRITDLNGKAVEGVPVQIKIDKESFVYTTNAKGEVELLTSYNVGKHKMTVSAVGNRYTSDSVGKTLNIKKASGKLTASNKKYYYNSGKYLTVKLVNTKNKKGIFNAKLQFKIKISKTKYSTFYGTTQKEGKIKLNVDLKPGKYEITIKGNDKKNFKANTLKTIITVKKAPVKLTTKTVKKQLQIKVTNKKSKKLVSGLKLKIKVYTGKKVKTFNAKSNKKGICNVNLNSIKKGTHKISVSLKNDYYSLNNYGKNIKIL